MAVIKNIAFCNRLKLKKNSTFKQFRGQGFTLLSPIVDLLNYLLPLNAKFLNEYFVAFENGEPVGLIGLQTTKGNRQKVKITNFLLEKNSPEIGEQLINYAIMKYCAIGAKSFFITIEQEAQDIEQLFLRRCGFRATAKEIIFDLNEKSDGRANNFSVFKPFKSSQTAALLELYNVSINAQHKYYFTKNINEFKNEFITGEKTSFKYVLENEEKNEIYGFIAISTQDNKNYVLDYFLSSAFSSYFLDVINFAKMQITKRTKNFNLYLKHRGYYYNSDELAEYTFSKGFKAIQRNVILTKDFLNVAKENLIIQNARIIFNDIKPAFIIETSCRKCISSDDL